MNKIEIENFISKNDDDKLLNLYDKLYEKLKSLNLRLDKYILYSIILFFIYLHLKNKTIEILSINSITIKDFSIVLQIIPFIFTYLLFETVILARHKSEVFYKVKRIFQHLYNEEIEIGNELNKHSLITRISLPYSYSTELSRLYETPKKLNILQSILGFILFFPIPFLFFVPLFIEYYLLSDLYHTYFTSIIGKISFILSLWLFLITIFYFIYNVRVDMQSNKKDSI